MKHCSPTPNNIYTRTHTLTHLVHLTPHQVRKSHQLEELAALMDELAPSLASSARGRGVVGDASSPSGTASSDTDSSGAASSAAGESEGGETVIGRCTAAALGTGVDCVLDEEFSASRQAGRVTGFPQVRETCPCLRGVSCLPVTFSIHHR